MSTISPIRKFGVQVLTVVSAFLVAWQTSGGTDSTLIATAIIGLCGALAVYLLANSPQHPAAKFGASVVTAVGAYVAFGLTADVVDPWRDGLYTLGVAVLGALILWLTPNAPDTVTA